MSNAFTVEPCEGVVMIRAGGAVIAETTAALILRESDRAPVYYLPREDAGTEFLDSSAIRTTCPHKGAATHYDLVLKSGTISDAAWSYLSPVAGAEAIAGYVAFYPDKVTVSAG